MLKLIFSTVVIGLHYFALIILSINAQDISSTQLPSNPIDFFNNIQCGPTDLEASRDNVTFNLYTRSNRDTSYIMKIDDADNLNASPFDGTRLTKYIIHGWISNSGLPWVVKMRQYYLDAGDYNVIAFDWSSISGLEYTTATRYAPSIGRIGAQMLTFLNTRGNLPLSNVHIIGHSLGAQVSGFIGADLPGISRITGLDPAGPCYGRPLLKDPSGRLDSTDARFVDIIHTDKRAYGISQISGHADFFPNGGDAPQPGCSGINMDSCSHGKSTDYMIESIAYPRRFLALQCDSWDSFQNGDCTNNALAYMGDACDPSTRGTYYLTTESGARTPT